MDIFQRGKRRFKGWVCSVGVYTIVDLIGDCEYRAGWRENRLCVSFRVLFQTRGGKPLSRPLRELFFALPRSQ